MAECDGGMHGQLCMMADLNHHNIETNKHLHFWRISSLISVTNQSKCTKYLLG